MNFLSKALQEISLYESYLKCIEKESDPVLVSGLIDVAKIQIAYSSKEFLNRDVLIITYNEIQAKKIISDLRFIDENILYFPKREILAYDYVAESKDLPYERIETLNKMQNNGSQIIVTTIEAIMQKMISKDSLYNNCINLKIGNEYPLESLKEKLLKLGYERTELVESRGTFSVRGGIVDIAISENEGVRIEFWGDEIDSIRNFKISSQRSINTKNEINIYPAHEFILEESIEKIINKINIRKGSNPELNKIIENDIEEIKNGNYYSKIDKYFNCFYKEQSNFIDFIKEDTIIFFDEESKVLKRTENIILDNNNLIDSLISKNKIVPDSIKNIDENIGIINQKNIVYLEKQDITTNKNIERQFHFHYREVNFFKSETKIIIDELKNAVNANKKIVILGGNENSARKISLLLTENDIPHLFKEKIDCDLINGTVFVTKGALSAGFESYDQNLLVISSDEFFSNSPKRKKQSEAFKNGEKVVFADLKIGDFVVHKFHGIGQFIGVNTIKADNIIKDYIKIKYKNDDILYVPTNNLDSIRKFIGGGEAIPKLNKLGGKEWETTKTKVKSNLREVAKELIELYAKREKIKGYAFSKDTEWQKQFEDSFPYTETDDQLRCIDETKKDMEAPKPMDRLLCRRCWIW